MNQVIESFAIDRAEGGEVLSSVLLTAEQNGFAIWYLHRHADPRLLAWHGLTPMRNAAGVFTAATVEARRIAREAIDHGTQYAAHRRFEQR